jgi:cyclic beta-1,2-glucan synthetase
MALPVVRQVKSLLSLFAGEYFRRRSLYSIPETLKHAGKQIRRAYDLFRSNGKKLQDPSEWLLDNYYVIRRSLEQVEEDIPFAFHRQLPILEDPGNNATDRTRIFSLARELTPGPDSLLSINGAVSFLLRRQKKTPLTIGELWALPSMLRLSILEHLSNELHSFINGSGGGEGVSVAVLNLRKIEETHWKTFFEGTSQVERILRTDPAGIYRKMDFATRNRYRNVIEELSRKHRLEETVVADTAVRLALEAGEGHIGFHLLDRQGRAALEGRLTGKASRRPTSRKTAAAAYIGGVALLTILFLVLFPVKTALSLLLLSVPAAALASDLASKAAVSLTKPEKLPKMDFSKGIPDSCATMVVMPVIFSREEELNSLLEQLERHYLSNGMKNLHFALLSDFADAPFETMPEDSRLLEAVRGGVDELNERHCAGTKPIFHLLHRRRQWNPGEECWMGWERKRGKLFELNELLLKNGPATFITSSPPGNIKFVITLDADTVLPGGAAAELVGAMAHPLNRYRGDTGYTVMQPRTLPLFSYGIPTMFFRTFSGNFAVDLYSSAASNVYQDLFGEGIYMGKGIYHVESFQESIRGRVPENSLLSHDLFEGILGRAAFLSDVILYEDFPPDFSSWLKRQHRWARGDWQLLPWLFRRGLSLLDRWKIADNLRRSLTDPAIMVMLLAGWLVLPGSGWLWTATAAVAVMRNQILETLFRVAAGSGRLQEAGWFRGFLDLALLPVTAVSNTHAVTVTLYRLFFRGKHLLQWTSAAEASKKTRGEKRGKTKFLPATLFAMTAGAVILFCRASALVPALPFLALWAAVPLIVNRITSRKKMLAALRPGDELMLEKTALKTWNFFETFVGPDDHWLPPDHFQEDPLGRVTHTTSPTNIGLYLLSAVAAGDMGYMGVRQLLLRLRDAVTGMSGLEKYRGHILNWHNTKTREALHPRYVSTVDSGNLLASLVVLSRACKETGELSVLSPERWRGLEVTVNILEDALAGSDGLKEFLKVVSSVLERAKDSDISSVMTHLEQLDTALSQMETEIVALMGSTGMTPEEIGEVRTWLLRARSHHSDMEDEIKYLYPWIPFLNDEVSRLSTAKNPVLMNAWEEFLEELPGKPSPAGFLRSYGSSSEKLRILGTVIGDITPEDPELRNRFSRLAELFGESRASCLGVIRDAEALGNMVDKEVESMDFSFLYHRGRDVFRIGFNVDSEQPDGNCYDLLASEARITSLLTIARRQVPPDHWLHLSRPFTSVSGMLGLLSWSGTMFEYLMPLLFTGYQSDTLLGKCSLAAVKRQMDYAKQLGVPWGVSESGYYRLDTNGQYQYRAFGVPGLGYKRDLGQDTVVAPYASMLALSIAPAEVVDNLVMMQSMGMTGPFGFYEAMDFTSSRLLRGKKFMPVKSYMAHHQGMILLAIQNYLQNDITVSRFTDEPVMRTVDLLLREQAPENPRIVYARPRITVTEELKRPSADVKGWQLHVDARVPRAHHLSNGNLSVVLTDSGGAFIKWKNMDITVWNPDTTRDRGGNRLFIRDVETGERMDACGVSRVEERPLCRMTCFPHRVEHFTGGKELSVAVETVIDPERDAALRKVTITNHTAKKRKLQICSHFEPALAAEGAYRDHPEFNRIFISSGFDSDMGLLILRRRKRSLEEEGVAVGQIMPGKELVHFETEREIFTGRGPGLAGTLSGKTGTTVDPVMAIAGELELDPEETGSVTFVTLCGGCDEELLSLAGEYTHGESVKEVFQRSEVSIRRELTSTGITSELMRRTQPVLSALLFPSRLLRAPEEALRNNTLGQRHLWRFGISGDHPVLLVDVNTTDNLDLLRDLLTIHMFWRRRNLLIDLVILNREETGYETDLQGKLHRLLASTGSDDWVGRRGGVFLIRSDNIHPQELALLNTWARVVLSCGAKLEQQLEALYELSVRQPNIVPVPNVPAKTVPALEMPEDLHFFNGRGGFTPDGGEYVIFLGKGEWTPRPWINVISNESTGFTASESGLQCAWAFNSGENRLTPWRNDPLLDLPGTAVYIRDEESGNFWSPSPLPSRDEMPYLVRHGMGYTSWEHNSNGLRQKMTAFIDAGKPVQALNISLGNTGASNRRISITLYLEPVLGTTREKTAEFIVSSFRTDSNALMAENTAGEKPPGGMFFISSSRAPGGLTTDREEFLGRYGCMESPAAMKRTGLSGSLRSGTDPCMAVQVMIWIGPHEEKEVTFLLGQAESAEDAGELIKTHMERAINGEMLAGAVAHWNGILGSLQVQTPDRAMNVMLNGWLLYQTLSCRMMGRTALYQSSGALGFRDQLQDCLALCHALPGKTREHILKSASMQFEEGDVLHWWHPPLNAGVRTRCSDDLCWLPYAASVYVEKTGDTAILREKVPFLKGEELKEGVGERYERFPGSKKSATLHLHCLLALEKGLTSGEHGLPLMGSHDWNDGMTLVGKDGRGESVWLGWFLYDTLTRYADTCRRIEDHASEQKLLAAAEILREAILREAWDGAWYLRGFYDDGHPLGSHINDECRIASIAQSWAVISGAGREEENTMALRSLSEKLVDRENGLILLFDPPFDKTTRHPGYIMGYPPGVRENGGQYTHAAIWAAWALAITGDGNGAHELFSMMNPVNKSDTPEKRDVYRTEPYAAAADVYSSPECPGRGGWTWYTGAAGWLYRLGTEAILGLYRKGDKLEFNPCVPDDWTQWRVDYRYKRAVYRIEFSNPGNVSTGILSVEHNGKRISGNSLKLSGSSARHEVKVTLGRV